MLDYILDCFGLVTMSRYDRMMDAAIDSEVSLASAKVLLCQQASLMPDCSRKTALFAEIDAL